MGRIFWPLPWGASGDDASALHLSLVQDKSTAVVTSTRERGSSRVGTLTGTFLEDKHSQLLRHPQCTLEVEGVQLLEGGLSIPKSFICSPSPAGRLQVFCYVPSEWTCAFQDEHYAAPGSLTEALQCLSLLLSPPSAQHASPAASQHGAAGSSSAAAAASATVRAEGSDNIDGPASSIGPHHCFHHQISPGIRSATVLCCGWVMDRFPTCIIGRWIQSQQQSQQQQQEEQQQQQQQEQQQHEEREQRQQQQLQPTEGHEEEIPEEDFAVQLPLPPQDKAQLELQLRQQQQQQQQQQQLQQQRQQQQQQQQQQRVPRNLLLPLPQQLPGLEHAAHLHLHQDSLDPACFNTYFATAAADLNSSAYSAISHGHQWYSAGSRPAAAHTPLTPHQAPSSAPVVAVPRPTSYPRPSSPYAPLQIQPARVLTSHVAGDTHPCSPSSLSPSNSPPHVRSVRFAECSDPAPPPPSTPSSAQSNSLETASSAHAPSSIIPSSSSRFKRSSVNTPSSPSLSPRPSHRLKRSTSAVSLTSSTPTPPPDELPPLEPSTSPPPKSKRKPTKIPSWHASNTAAQLSSQITEPALSPFAKFKRRASASFFGLGQSKIPSPSGSRRGGSDASSSDPRQQLPNGEVVGTQPSSNQRNLLKSASESPSHAGSTSRRGSINANNFDPTQKLPNGGVKGTQSSSSQRNLQRSASESPNRAGNSSSSSSKSSLACSRQLQEVVPKGGDSSSVQQRRKSQGSPPEGSINPAPQLSAAGSDTRCDTARMQRDAYPEGQERKGKGYIAAPASGAASPEASSSGSAADDAAFVAGAAAGRASSSRIPRPSYSTRDTRAKSPCSIPAAEDQAPSQAAKLGSSDEVSAAPARGAVIGTARSNSGGTAKVVDSGTVRSNDRGTGAGIGTARSISGCTATGVDGGIARSNSGGIGADSGTARSISGATNAGFGIARSNSDGTTTVLDSSTARSTGGVSVRAATASTAPGGEAAGAHSARHVYMSTAVCGTKALRKAPHTDYGTHPQRGQQTDGQQTPQPQRGHPLPAPCSSPPPPNAPNTLNGRQPQICSSPPFPHASSSPSLYASSPPFHHAPDSPPFPHAPGTLNAKQQQAKEGAMGSCSSPSFPHALDTPNAKQQQAKEGAIGSAKGRCDGVGGLHSQQGLRQRSMPVVLVPKNYMLLCSLLQHLLGLWLGLLLWMHSDDVLQWIESSGLRLRQGMDHNITWLMAARPFGIKLHAELCFLYGRALLHVVQTVAAVAAPVWHLCAPCTLCLLAMLGAVFGAIAVLAACRDLLLLACMPLTVAHCGMACLLRLQLHYVKSMWGMVRGNVRKPRQMQLRAMAANLASTASPSSMTAPSTTTTAAPSAAPGAAATVAPPAGGSSCELRGSTTTRHPSTTTQHQISSTIGPSTTRAGPSGASGAPATVASPAGGSSCGEKGNSPAGAPAPGESAVAASPAGDSCGGAGAAALGAAVPGAPFAMVTAGDSRCGVAGKALIQPGRHASSNVDAPTNDVAVRSDASSCGVAGKALIGGQRVTSNGNMHVTDVAVQGTEPCGSAARKACSDERAAVAHERGVEVPRTHRGANSALCAAGSTLGVEGGLGVSTGRERGQNTHLQGAGEHCNGCADAALESEEALMQASKQQGYNVTRLQGEGRLLSKRLTASQQQGPGEQSIQHAPGADGAASPEGKPCGAACPGAENGAKQQGVRMQGDCASAAIHGEQSPQHASSAYGAACLGAMPGAEQQGENKQGDCLSAAGRARELPEAKLAQETSPQGNGSVRFAAGCSEAVHASERTGADEQGEGVGPKNETAHAAVGSGAEDWNEEGGQKSERAWFHVPGLRGNRLASESLWGMGTKKKQEVMAEPLIVGVLLFVPLLALLPTTLAWHLFVTSAHMAAVMLRSLLLLLASLLRHNPLLLLVWRLASPMSFPGGFTVDLLVPANEAMTKRNSRSWRTFGWAKQPAAQGLVKWTTVRNAQLHSRAQGRPLLRPQPCFSPGLPSFEHQQCATDSRPFDRFMCSHFSLGHEHPAQRHQQRLQKNQLKQQQQQRNHQQQQQQQQENQQQQQHRLQQVNDSSGHTTFYAVQRLPLPISSLLGSCAQSVLGSACMQPYPTPCAAAGQEEQVRHHFNSGGKTLLMDLTSCLACGDPAFWQC